MSCDFVLLSCVSQLGGFSIFPAACGVKFPMWDLVLLTKISSTPCGKIQDTCALRGVYDDKNC